MSAVTNGQIRKSLAEQIDRLDAILDTLAEGLNEAVAGVVSQAVTGAVEAAVVEVLTNPTLQQRLRAAEKSDRATVNFGRRVWGWLKAGCTWVAGRMKRAFTKTVKVAGVCKDAAFTTAATAGHKTRAALKAGWSHTLSALALAGRMRRSVLVAVAAGLTIGTACYFSGPLLSSLISGVTGFVSAMATRTWNSLAGLLAGEDPRGN
jgi:hypothetical protein